MSGHADGSAEGAAANAAATEAMAAAEAAATEAAAVAATLPALPALPALPPLGLTDASVAAFLNGSGAMLPMQPPHSLLQLQLPDGSHLDANGHSQQPAHFDEEGMAMLPAGKQRFNSAWLLQHDLLLLHAMQSARESGARLGDKFWPTVTELMNGADPVHWYTHKQVRERWSRRYENAMNKRGAWTDREEYVFALSHSKAGNKWARIMVDLPHRTENTIKNRFNSTGRSKPHNDRFPGGTLFARYCRAVYAKQHPPGGGAAVVLGGYEQDFQDALAYVTARDGPAAVAAYAVDQHHFIRNPLPPDGEEGTGEAGEEPMSAAVVELAASLRTFLANEKKAMRGRNSVPGVMRFSQDMGLVHSVNFAAVQAAAAAGVTGGGGQQGAQQLLNQQQLNNAFGPGGVFAPGSGFMIGEDGQVQLDPNAGAALLLLQQQQIQQEQQQLRSPPAGRTPVMQRDPSGSNLLQQQRQQTQEVIHAEQSARRQQALSTARQQLGMQAEASAADVSRVDETGGQADANAQQEQLLRQLQLLQQKTLMQEQAGLLQQHLTQQLMQDEAVLQQLQPNFAATAQLPFPTAAAMPSGAVSSAQQGTSQVPPAAQDLSANGHPHSSTAPAAQSTTQSVSGTSGAGSSLQPSADQLAELLVLGLLSKLQVAAQHSSAANAAAAASGGAPSPAVAAQTAAALGSILGGSAEGAQSYVMASVSLAESALGAMCDDALSKLLQEPQVQQLLQSPSPAAAEAMNFNIAGAGPPAAIAYGLRAMRRQLLLATRRVLDAAAAQAIRDIEQQINSCGGGL